MSDGICQAYARHNGVKYECHGVERHSGKHFAVKGDGTLHEWTNWRAEETPEYDHESWPALTADGKFVPQVPSLRVNVVEEDDDDFRLGSIRCMHQKFTDGKYRYCEFEAGHDGPHKVGLSGRTPVTWNAP